MTTPLYPTFKKRVHDAVDQLIKKQVTPWAFFNSGHPFRIQAFDNRPISYGSTGGFESAPHQVFWSRYIEPFLEDLCLTEIKAAIEMAQHRGVDGKLVLSELRDLLSAGCLRVYKRMADIDRRLRGRGFPDKVQIRPIDRELAVMNEFIDEHINAELEMWKPTPQPSVLFKRLSFWQWFIGIVIAAIGVIATILVSG